MKKCIDCGKSIGLTSTRCRKCANKANKEKNSKGVKLAHIRGAYINRPKKGYGPANSEWRKNNYENYRELRNKQAEKLRGKTHVGCIHTDEFKKRQSILMSERLKDPEKRKNYGRGKKSHMELYFENWLIRNNISGWSYDKHFWNEELSKNYFVDYYFESLKLIIELDGTQHRNTIEADSIRDKYFIKQGYRVVRLPYSEYRKGKWEKNFLEIIQTELLSFGCSNPNS